MGLSRGLFGYSLEVSGPFGGPRGASWGSLGALLGGLGALLGLFGGVWEVSWGHLGGHRSKKGGGGPFGSPPVGALKFASWGTLGALLGALGPVLEATAQRRGDHFCQSPVGARNVASWGPLGPLLGRSWALLGPSWASLGPLLGLSWAILGPSRGLKSPSEAKKREGKKHRFSLGFGRNLASWGSPWRARRALKTVFGPSGGLWDACRKLS